MAIRKMGPIANLLGMLPGAGQMKERSSSIDDRDLDRTAAIIRSMTPAERVNSEDHQRLAPGADRQRLRGRASPTSTSCSSGSSQAQKMMSQMAGGMGLPGMGPMSKKARGRQMQAQCKKGKKGKGKRAVRRAGPWVPRALPPPAPGFPGGGVSRPACRRSRPVSSCPT